MKRKLAPEKQCNSFGFTYEEQKEKQYKYEKEKECKKQKEQSTEQAKEHVPEQFFDIGSLLQPFMFL